MKQKLILNKEIMTIGLLDLDTRHMLNLCEIIAKMFNRNEPRFLKYIDIEVFVIRELSETYNISKITFSFFISTHYSQIKHYIDVQKYNT